MQSGRNDTAIEQSGVLYVRRSVSLATWCMADSRCNVATQFTTGMKVLKSVNMDFVGDAITHAQAEGLTEGQLARELGYHTQAPDPGQMRHTIAWWEDRQVMEAAFVR